ncbi:amidase signature enzyme [Corynespora cassiicola Philippines]|uniref:Amidase signature enzyme n=1 Tax=Corynespora cassiicola Philippines TaxID=1448308 RepID=A0A2T2NYZ2_CORCC|nr:amidase signature enzyme [Corynespora cassiicola Philippines]
MEVTDLAPEGDKKQQTLEELRVGTDRYLLLWPKPFSDPGLKEVSVLTAFEYDKEDPVELDWIRNKVKEYSTEDDVFRLEFLQAIVILHSYSESLKVTGPAREFLRGQGTRIVAARRIDEKEGWLSPGPYYHCNKNLRPIWKLYEDTCGAFLYTAIPGREREPFKLQTAGHTPGTLAIAIPTRIKSYIGKKDVSKSALRGWRIAVKDNFHIKNLHTTVCNPAYHDLYTPSESTAACIQKLYDAGAYIVGTTKLASFAGTEEPMQCIDWQAPFNPRSDGYYGSGAEIAAYPWLDITVGSDTSGSGRRPGLWNGCFAMRPSHGYLPHEGLVGSFPQFDVPTFFGRDLVTCKIFAEAWYGQLLPRQVSIKQVDASLHSFFYEDYHNFETFRRDYRAKFGKDAYISSPVRWQWELSSCISSKAHLEAMRRLEVYKDWFNEAIMKPDRRRTLVLLPIEEIAPRYRDEMPKTHFKPVGVPNLFLSPILKTPELTVPIGSYPYQSKVSGAMEKLPVVISVVGPPGQDVFLIDIVLQCLRSTCRPHRVLTSPEMF